MDVEVGEEGAELEEEVQEVAKTSCRRDAGWGRDSGDASKGVGNLSVGS